MTAINSSNAFVTLPLDDLMYILLDDEETFNAIRLPEGRATTGGSGRLVQFKSGKMDGVRIVFQFWPQKETQSHGQ